MKLLATAAIIAATFASTQVMAQDLTVTVTNLTHGMDFTPVLFAAHDTNGNLYDVGKVANDSLREMAEGGALASLKLDLDGIAATYTDTAAPVLAGTTSAELTLNTDANPDNTKLTVVAMLLPTNDAFLGLDAIDIPATAGTYTYYLNAYDAGSEANNELVVDGGGALGTPGIPNAPFVLTNGTGGIGGVAGDDNVSIVHIHRGTIGDDNLTAGNSDLVNTVHRWLNPVARVTVVVK